LLHALLTPEECDELVAMARPELEASTVVDVSTGQGMLSQVRTSSGMFIMHSTPTVDTIRQRVSHIVHLPEENQEAIQILRYKPGQFYKYAPPLSRMCNLAHPCSHISLAKTTPRLLRRPDEY
jgi:prolyl 4-hydroxylase